ncbi:hypothetical protein [Mesotoga sp.]|uniref:DUF7014 domain-containing protein n=1 Tax=Mesotoga sp. TaxID=2053577 RepID=UPI00345E5B6A
MITFSKRFAKALKEKTLQVKIPGPVRNRLKKAVVDHDEVVRYSEPQNPTFYIENWASEMLPEILEKEFGITELKCPIKGSRKGESCTPLEYIVRGTRHQTTFDILELFYRELYGDNRNNFQHAVNEIFEESELPFIMIDGDIFSSDLDNNIRAQSLKILETVGFEGALAEFKQAQEYFSDDKYKESINYCNLSIESVLKTILKISREKPGKLFAEFIKSGYVPEYFDDFLKEFEHILRSVAIIRNQVLGVGRGQGDSVNDVPKSLADLSIDLSSVLIKFIINRYLESEPPQEESFDSSNDIPF